jgi:outer membrane receptor for ferrienterochelin and colicin
VKHRASAALAAASLAALAASPAALAHDAAPNAAPDAAPAAVPTRPEMQTAASVVVYDDVFFARYNVTTAEDMLRLIPGVASILDQGEVEGGVRGFGSEGAQILINGERVVAKFNGVVGEMRRIRAAAVERVELIRGAQAGVNVQSQGVVVNVVLRPGASTGGALTWEAAAKANDERFIGVEGLATYSGVWRGADYSIGVEHTLWSPPVFAAGFWSDRFRDERWFFPDGTMQQIRPQDWTKDNPRYDLTGSVSNTFDDGSSLRLNGLYRYFEVDETFDQPFTRFAADGTVAQAATDRQNRVIDYNSFFEIGGEHVRPLWGGEATLAFIVTREEAPETFDRFRLENGAELEVAQIARQTDLGEDILRAFYTRTLTARHSVEFGGELVRNTLEQDLDAAFDRNGDGVVEDVFDQDGDGVTDPEFAPAAFADVQEDRWEGFVEHNWTVTGALTLESSLTYESSEITTNDPIARGNAFSFWKPRVDARYTLPGGAIARAKVERTVSQLTFANFVPVYDVLDNEVDAGNPDLRPETAWVYEVGYERRLPNDGGVVQARLFYQDISDHVDKVIIRRDDDPNNPLPDDGLGRPVSAFGNLPSAERYGAEVEASIRLGSLGLPGVLLTSRYLVQESETTDPFTGQSRPMRDAWDHELDFGFRHDVSGLGVSYGANYQSFGGEVVYSDVFVSELYEVEPRIDAFVEKQLSPRLTLRVEGWSLGQSRESRDRVIYADSAAQGTVLRLESFEEVRDRRLIVKLRGSF